MKLWVQQDYLQLTAAMLRTGLLGFGGGPSTIPLMQHEAVNRYKWMTTEEFGEILALGNALPGPIATKMAIYIGYHVRKTPGAIIALLAHILPTALAMVLLLATLLRYQSSPVVAGMINGVKPVIAVMLGLMTYEFARKAVSGLGWWFAALCFVLVFAVLQFTRIHAAFVILVFVGYGVFHHRVLDFIKGRRERKKGSSTWNG